MTAISIYVNRLKTIVDVASAKTLTDNVVHANERDEIWAKAHKD